MDKSKMENSNTVNTVVGAVVLPPKDERVDTKEDRAFTTNDDFSARAGKIDFLET